MESFEMSEGHKRTSSYHLREDLDALAERVERLEEALKAPEVCPGCAGSFMIPSDDPDGDVMNTPCPACNEWSPEFKENAGGEASPNRSPKTMPKKLTQSKPSRAKQGRDEGLLSSDLFSVFTVGHEANYDRGIVEYGKKFQKLGRRKDYPGGFAVRTPEDAERLIDEHGKRGEWAVYALAADWEKDTVPSENGWWHALVKSSLIICKIPSLNSREHPRA